MSRVIMFSGAMEREQQAVMGYKMSGKWEMRLQTPSMIGKRDKDLITALVA